MIEYLDRQTFFREHPVAARYTAAEQQWGYHNLAEEEPRYADALRRRRWYDCLEYLHGDAPPLDGFTALAYAAETRKDYRAQFPVHVLRFLQQLGAQEFYLFGEYPTDWMMLDFGLFRSRKELGRLMGKKHFDGCFKTDAEGFLRLFPFFLFTRNDHSRIVSLYAKGKDTSVVLFLCDDGNLHTSYPAQDEARVLEAAAAAGLETGDPFFICGTYFVQRLPAF